MNISENEIEIQSSEIIFSAGSIITTPAFSVDFNTDTHLSDLRWYLYDADGKVVYFQAAEGRLISDADDTFDIDSIEVRVPFNPSQGGWSLRFGNKGVSFGLFTKEIYRLSFNVGESTSMDNLFAPIYITWEGFPGVKWGEFSVALPGLFWLSSPIWGFLAFFIVLAFARQSFKTAGHEISEGFNKIRKFRKKNGGKNNNEKFKKR